MFLDDDAEPQPDLFLRILPEFGGLSRDTHDDYVDGPPELTIEIAHNTRSIDLHSKRADYTRCRVPEYLVYLVKEQRLAWFNLTKDLELQRGPDRIFKLRQFPGLWIDETALVKKDFAKLTAVLNRVLATPEHQAFTERLSKARMRSSQKQKNRANR